jgi:thiosulfate/3-mercaptopyruvate sulfurtransferase
MVKEYPYGNGVVKWVSTEWLEAQLTDGGLHILDCQPNIHDYISEHLPGALFMDEGLWRIPLKGTPGAWVTAEAAQLTMRRLGLRADMPVVVYTGKGAQKGWGDGLGQTMVSYSLARFGHDNVLLLDGGIDKWKMEGRELTKVFPTAEESDFVAGVRSEYFVEYEELKRLKDREDVILLDARPPDVYAGQGPWIKAGHIPGAVNLPWKSLMDGENPALLRPGKEIQAILDEAGVTSDKTIICSCGTGREATNEFLLFKWYLGYPKVKLDEGAFTKWSSYPDNPTIAGSSPWGSQQSLRGRRGGERCCWRE